MDRKEVIVIGGGAAGLVAAIYAADEGARVTVLERDKKVGRKLLRTGNGRCNLSNKAVSPDRYEERGRKLAAEVLRAFPPEETLAFFREIGIITRDIDGYIYPYNEEASSVLSALSLCAESKGVRIRQNADVTDILPKEGSFDVVTEGWTYAADKVVCASGSPAGLPDGTPDFLGVLEKLGHHVYPVQPALSLIRIEPSVRPLAGVRVRGCVTLLADGAAIGRESGQIQFTDRGISGICVMNLCARALAAVKDGKHTELSVDLIPDGATEEYELTRCECSLLPGKMLAYLKKTGLKTSDVIRDLRFTVTGSSGLSGAQAAYGGVDTDCVDGRTLESRLVPGLFFAGEVLDVTGLCGGFNLQFAWSSGALAGKHAGSGMRG